MSLLEQQFIATLDRIDDSQSKATESPPSLAKDKLEAKVKLLSSQLADLSQQVSDLQEVTSRVSVLLGEAAKNDDQMHPRFREIVRAACEFYGVTELEIMSRRRAPRVAIPRQVIYYLARHLTSMSYPEIGRRIGGKDHTTVLHGARQIEKRAGAEHLIRDDLDVLQAKIAAAVLERNFGSGGSVSK